MSQINKPSQSNFVRDATPLCQSLSGIDVPMLIVSSRIKDKDFNMMSRQELPADEVIPSDGKKRVIIMTGRVHPGETNSSYMMEGFIKFITGNSRIAQELRKRIVFKIVPCINPDGVIAGNYRVSMAGSDLNRKYINPH